MIVGSVQLHQSLDGILHLGHEDHSGNDIGLVGSLFVQRNDVSIEHGVVHFAFLAAQTGNIGGQAVHVQSLAVLGELHHFLGAGPILVLGVLRQQLLLQGVNTSLIAGGVQLGALFHSGKGSPGLGIHDVGVLEGLSHAVGLVELGAVLLTVLAGHFLHLGHHVVSFRVSQGHVHSEAGEQTDNALRHGQGLAVGGRICPGHSNLLTLQVLHTTEVVDHMQHIGHALGGMVHIALQVHQSGTLLQDALTIAVFQSVHEGLLIGVALADVHIIADTDDISHEGHHVRGLADGLAVSDLGLLLVQNLLFQTQQVAGGSEGEAGTGGVVAEQGNAQAGIKNTGALVALTQVTQSVGYGEDGVDLIIGLVPSPIEIALIHVVDVQGLQMAGQFNGLTHVDYLLVK